MMTETDSLLYGIEWPAESGQMHYEFELRMAAIGDNIHALEAHPDGSALTLSVAMMAECLVRLGGIPATEITFDLLARTLEPDDYDLINTAWTRLKKKRMRSSASSQDTGALSSFSADTGLTRPTSAA